VKVDSLPTNVGACATSGSTQQMNGRFHSCGRVAFLIIRCTAVTGLCKPRRTIVTELRNEGARVYQRRMGLIAKNESRRTNASARASGAIVTLLVVLLGSAGCVAIPANELALSSGPIRDQWSVEWDPLLRTPIRMTNASIDAAITEEGEDPAAESGQPVRSPIDPTSAEAALRRVFLDEPDFFRMRREDDFVLVRTSARNWLRVVRLAQTYRGVPVAGAGYEAHVVPNGRVGTIQGRFYPEIIIDVQPGLVASQAEGEARTALLSGNPVPDFTNRRYEHESGFRDRHVLTVLPHRGRYILSWGVIIEVAPREVYRVYVDAQSGEVLGRERVYGQWAR